MPTLLDQKTGESRKLIRSVTLIGRADYCDVCIPSPLVSREHARIVRKLTGTILEDLGSTYGTRLNDVRIRRRARLRDGDVITIGVAREEPSPPPPSDGDPIGPLFEAAAREPAVGATFLFQK